jgi:PAS domain S-box-containing protein
MATKKETSFQNSRFGVVIRQNADRINTILKTSNEGFWLINNDLITVDVNPKLCKILGRPKREIIGKSIYDFVDSQNHKIFMTQVAARNLGKKSTYEIDLLRPDGSSIPCLMNASPFVANDGKKIGAFAMVTDITERKRAEEALKTSESRYRGLVEHAPIGILYIEKNGKILEVNPKLVEILGAKSIKAMLSINIYKSKKMVEAGISKTVQECIDKGLTSVHECYYKPHVGQNVYLRYHLNPVRNNGNEIEGVLGNVIDFSNYKETQERLKRTHEIYRSAIVNAQGVPYRLDFKQGKYEFFGEGFQKLLGISAQNLSYERLDKITEEVVITDPEIPQNTTKYGEAFREGKIERLRMDIKLKAKNGKIRWLSDCSIPLRDNETGIIVGSLGIMQDITERKRIETALKDSEDRYRTLFTSASDAIFLMKGDKFVECNPKTLDIFGCTLEQIIQKPPYRFSPKYQADGRLSKEKALEKINLTYDGKPQFFEWLHCRYDRSQFDAEVSLNRIELSHETFILAVVRDITDRKRAVQTLRESEEKYRALFDQARNAIFLENDKQEILDANQAASELFGYTHDEFLNMKTSGLRSDSGTKIQIYLNPEQGSDMPVELTGVKKDGSQIAIEVTITPLHTSHEVLFLSIVRDITERKRLERQLQQSQKMEAIGRLAGGVAHDFNNLLTVIRGYSELVLSRLSKIDPIYQRIKQIDKASERAESLTRQLLAFSRRQILQSKIVNLNDLLQDMGHMLRRLISEDIELILALDDKLGHIKADPSQIEQIIMNLAVNACDAMPDGGRLCIETQNTRIDRSARKRHPEMKPGLYVMLAISDTGIGMDKDTQSHIFEPFFTTKAEGEGTGLGLATVYGTIKQSDGYIWVYSEEKQGSIFKIYLPCVDQALEKAEVASTSDDELKGTETILLVEDEVDVRTLVKETLEMMNYKVIEAADGKQALQMCKRFKKPIQLVLTDVVMPNMSGRELVDELNKIRPEIKSLYMSGYTENAIVHKGVLDPGTQFLQKPFTPLDLVQKVREVLDNNV